MPKYSTSLSQNINKRSNGSSSVGSPTIGDINAISRVHNKKLLKTSFSLKKDGLSLFIVIAQTGDRVNKTLPIYLGRVNNGMFEVKTDKLFTIASAIGCDPQSILDAADKFAAKFSQNFVPIPSKDRHNSNLANKRKKQKLDAINKGVRVC